AYERSESEEVAFITQLVKKLLIIISRPARLLECLPTCPQEFDPAEFYQLLTAAEGQGLLKADIPRYIIGQLGLARDPFPGTRVAVYLVRHRATRQRFAMKKINKQNLLLRNQVQQAFVERDILTFAENPFVVSMFCSFQTRRHLCMVMEYVEGAASVGLGIAMQSWLSRYGQRAGLHHVGLGITMQSQLSRYGQGAGLSHVGLGVTMQSRLSRYGRRAELRHVELGIAIRVRIAAQPGLLMSRYVGGDCATLLKHIGALPLELARLYFAETVLALEYLHNYGIVHRDLKPDKYGGEGKEGGDGGRKRWGQQGAPGASPPPPPPPRSLLITSLGHVKLTDFGLSKMGLMSLTTNLYEGHMEKDAREFRDKQVGGARRWAGPAGGRGRWAGLTTPPGPAPQVCGTPEYIAPEVILRQGYGKPVDWWAMGIVLYEFLVGCVPFFGDTPEELFGQVISGMGGWGAMGQVISGEAAGSSPLGSPMSPRSLSSDPSSRDSSPGRELAPAVSAPPRSPIAIPRPGKKFGFTLRAIRVYLGDSDVYSVHHVVWHVEEGGPAQEAGLCAGDLITHVNGEPVHGLVHTEVVELILK
ncbi:hypothetical protein ASZ78_008265, partial [Callipepla squamata]